MKFCFVGLWCFAASATLAANALNFGNELPTWKLKDGEIKWAVTNQLRRDLWVYKVIPQTFQAEGIKELLRQGSFTNIISGDISNNFTLVNKANTCFLQVNPAQGSITYWNEYAPANHWDKTNHLWEKVEGLPSQSEAEKFGLRFLRQFGIQRKDLAQRADGHLITFGEEQSRSYFDRRTQTNIEDEVKSRGIFFNRRIEGVDFTGIGIRGGCGIAFGNHGKISQFNLVWRNLKPYEHYKTASAEEMIQFIRDGEAVITRRNPVNPADIKSITITDVSFLYMGAKGDEKQDFVYPFAQVNVRANLGSTNADIQLFCPILSTNKLGQ
jgi:hypothetical protein